MKHIFLNVMFTVVFPALKIHSVSHGIWPLGAYSRYGRKTHVQEPRDNYVPMAFNGKRSVKEKWLCRL